MSFDNAVPDNVPQWATPTTLFPVSGNPWSATVVGASPGYAYFTPGIPPAAQEINYEFNLFTSQLQKLYNWTTAMGLANWTPWSVVGWAPSALGWNWQNQYWQSYYGQFVTGVTGGSQTIDVKISTGGTPADGGSLWVSLSATLKTVNLYHSFGTGPSLAKAWTSDAFVFLAADSDIVSGQILSGASTTSSYFVFTGKTFAHGTSGGTVTSAFVGVVNNQAFELDVAAASINFNTSTDTIQALSLTGACVQGTAYDTFASGQGPVVFGFIQSGGTYIGYIAPNFLYGLQLTQTGLPALWQTDTNHVTSIISAHKRSTTSSSHDGQVVLAMCGTTPGTDTSRLLLIENATGTTFTYTDVTPAGLTSSIDGLAYSERDALWGIVLRTSGDYTYVLTTPSPISPSSVWTTVLIVKDSLPTGGSRAGAVGNGSLASIGSGWVLSVYYTSRNAGVNASMPDNLGPRILYCTDLAQNGANAQWRFAANDSLNVNNGNLTTGDGTIMQWGAQGFHSSLQIGNHLGYSVTAVGT